MSNEGYQLDKKSLEIIQKVVSEFNASKSGNGPSRPQASNRNNRDGFFAKITDKSGDKYGWIQQRATSDGEWEDVEGIEGTVESKYAKELNNNDAPIGSIVFLRVRHDYFVFQFGSGSHYAIVPRCGTGIPARSGIYPGVGLGCLYYVEDGELTPVLNEDEEQVGVTVYNIRDVAVPVLQAPNQTYLLAHQDSNGNWLIEPPTLSGGPNTTTTPYPGEGLPGGQCKYEWNGSSWDLLEGNCAEAAATTTTEEPNCLCDFTTTTTTTTEEPGEETTTTTTAEPTTTTPEPEWECQYPQFCGTEVGQCTYTDCVPVGSSAPPPDCPPEPDGGTTTTTSTTPDPGTTTPDCNTTPDPYAGCGDGPCLWKQHPFGGWILISGGCGSSTTCTGGVNICGSCAYPEGSGSGCGTTTTECIRANPLPCPPAPQSCGGGYSFVCFNGAWQVAATGTNGCSGAYYCDNCTDDCGCRSWTNVGGCSAPAIPQGSCTECAMQYRACSHPNCTPCNDSPGSPCGTTQPPTTTTEDPCGSGCIQKGNGSGGWNIVEDNCLGECECLPPGFDSEDDCHTVHTICSSEDPPTTEEPTTTTVAPTTTTTAAPTTTTTLPWVCYGLSSEDLCEEGTRSCVQMNAIDFFACITAGTCTDCGIGFTSTQEACEEAPACGTTPEPTTTTTTAAPTTTSTTEEPTNWYCCDTGSGCNCQEVTLGNCNAYCAGPFDSEETCQESFECAPTTTTEECNPFLPCSTNCVLVCIDNVVDVLKGCFGTACSCDLSPEIAAQVGTFCEGPNGVIGSAGPCCNNCEGSINPCQYTTTPEP